MDLASIRIQSRSVTTLLLIVGIFIFDNCQAIPKTTKTPSDEAQITFDAQLKIAEVELCFDSENLPRSLTAARDLSNNIRQIWARRGSDKPIELRLNDDTVALPDENLGCLIYVIELPEGHKDTWRSGLIRHNGGLVLELEQLLLRRTASPRVLGQKLFFNTNNYAQVSAPGRVIERSRGRVGFALMERPNDWSGSVAVGELKVSSFGTDGVNIEVAIIGNVSVAVATKLESWVRTGIGTLTELYGRLPVSELQILVFPLGYNADPVPWGEVTRGGGDAVHLYVDSTRSLDELNKNWVLTHELSHLTHPYLAGSDAWLSEGIASYYQNVLRARSGLLERKNAWEKLDAGFKRGMAQFDRVDTLAQDTQLMMRQRQYMRVYWSGAAIALVSDVGYFENSGGKVTLGAVLDKFSQCCLPSHRRWRALELMTKLDELAGFDVMVPLHEKYVIKPTFPEIEDAYKILGLQRHSDRLLLDNNPDAVRRRLGIMGRASRMSRPN